jgi:predicted SAM-dependent methyltransferase
MFENKLNILVKAYNYIDQRIRYRRISQKIKKETRHSPIRIVVGASGIFQVGWMPTDKEHLDIVNPKSWRKYFRKGTIDAILAEHVWEHLTPDEAVVAATNCFRFLKPGGYLRVAVPDGLHPDPGYIEWVCPGGSGPGADDHKVLYTYDTFRKVFASAGFDVSMCEYFDESGEFHSIEWEPADGMIQRSQRFDKIIFDRSKSGGHFDFTSIILDAIKPANHKALKQ